MKNRYIVKKLILTTGLFFCSKVLIAKNNKDNSQLEELARNLHQMNQSMNDGQENQNKDDDNISLSSLDTFKNNEKPTPKNPSSSFGDDDDGLSWQEKSIEQFNQNYAYRGEGYEDVKDSIIAIKSNFIGAFIVASGGIYTPLFRPEKPNDCYEILAENFKHSSEASDIANIITGILCTPMVSADFIANLHTNILWAMGAESLASFFHVKGFKNFIDGVWRRDVAKVIDAGVDVTLKGLGVYSLAKTSIMLLNSKLGMTNSAKIMGFELGVLVGCALEAWLWAWGFKKLEKKRYGFFVKITYTIITTLLVLVTKYVADMYLKGYVEMVQEDVQKQAMEDVVDKEVDDQGVVGGFTNALSSDYEDVDVMTIKEWFIQKMPKLYFLITKYPKISKVVGALGVFLTISSINAFRLYRYV